MIVATNVLSGGRSRKVRLQGATCNADRDGYSINDQIQ
ncbi:hypothetical protein ACPOL_2786 [Acidisarcina polymorpha]|uniref:Uncharacterized protein n=1 Tax=Acidisarcina polymorpha TaxID=2211140 RepID=A0A2Z5FZZ5_9BACT|nr:hypothetical protein ACPOL_2786 [Acidisarcina polymorpha]